MPTRTVRPTSEQPQLRRRYQSSTRYAIKPSKLNGHGGEDGEWLSCSAAAVAYQQSREMGARDTLSDDPTPEDRGRVHRTITSLPRRRAAVVSGRAQARHALDGAGQAYRNAMGNVMGGAIFTLPTSRYDVLQYRRRATVSGSFHQTIRSTQGGAAHHVLPRPALRDHCHLGFHTAVGRGRPRQADCWMTACCRQPFDSAPARWGRTGTDPA